MIIITGSKTAQGFRMHSPAFPYDSTHYIGYTLEQMKRKYRKDFNLQRKHIEWIIV